MTENNLPKSPALWDDFQGTVDIAKIHGFQRHLGKEPWKDTLDKINTTNLIQMS